MAAGDCSAHRPEAPKRRTANDERNLLGTQTAYLDDLRRKGYEVRPESRRKEIVPRRPRLQWYRLPGFWSSFEKADQAAYWTRTKAEEYAAPFQIEGTPYHGVYVFDLEFAQRVWETYLQKEVLRS